MAELQEERDDEIRRNRLESAKHDIGHMDDSGRRIFHQVIPHSQIGFQQFHEKCE